MTVAALLAAGLLPGAGLAEGKCPVAAPHELWREAVCDIGDAPDDMDWRAVMHLGSPGMASLPGAETRTGFFVLIEDGYFVQLADDLPGQDVAAAFNGLLIRRGLQELDPAEWAILATEADRAKAGGGRPAQGAAALFIDMVDARGYRLLYMPDDGFFVVSEAIWCKWHNVRLTRGIALTEWYDERLGPGPELLGRLRDGPDRDCGEAALS